MIGIHRYDLATFPFPDALAEMLGVDDLTALQAEAGSKPDGSIYKVMEHDPLYRNLRTALLDERSERFRGLYHRFVAEVIRPLFEEPIHYQACPTVRLLFRETSGEARFHRDADYGHALEEVNFWVPLTSAAGTNSIWIESAPGHGDHAPVEMGPGEFLAFDGASLSHGAAANDTGRSRVSFDFRAIAQSRSAKRQLIDRGPPERLDAHLFTSLDR
ncbi:hypothetical protein [Erythrobacter sp.]|jgi:hypothetical protein|uniref:hypothetical protein n=1 Tax=Erythrobacter sp. TaxID=1042 RepID=UPI002EB4FE49|nr:hypothetical protein [Erythrobacter sp.]